MKKKHSLLVAFPSPQKYDLGRVENYAKVYWAHDLNDSELDGILPTIDCMLVSYIWLPRINSSRLAMMRNLRLIQSVVGGVTTIPYKEISRKVTICSNVGAYNARVSEHAFGLLLAAAKGVQRFRHELENGTFDRPPAQDHKWLMILEGKTLGIIGYGNIGQSVVPYAQSFGMHIHAFGRRKMPKQKNVKFYSGKRGLERILRECDALILSIPLTKLTRNMIGTEELLKMKESAILVNIARGDLVDMKELYDHLASHQDFTYATDVLWFKGGSENYLPELPFFALPNFVVTPHLAGGPLTGGHIQYVIENLLRYFKREKLRNLVERSDYV